MQESMALEKTRSNLPDLNKRNEACLKAAALDGLPYPQAEASMKAEIDRISEVSATDPLTGLDQILGLMQGVNLELAKAYTPVLIENARLVSDKFITDGKIAENKRDGGRMFTQFLSLQETLIKTGVAQTRVRDELERRRY